MIDSTPVLGAGVVQDTYTLLRSALRKLLNMVRRSRSDTHQRLLSLLKRQDYDETGKPEIDWKDPQARQDLLNEFVQDARTVLAETAHLDLTTDEKAARELLAVVTEQDVEEHSAGTVALKQ